MKILLESVGLVSNFLIAMDSVMLIFLFKIRHNENEILETSFDRKKYRE